MIQLGDMIRRELCMELDGADKTTALNQLIETIGRAEMPGDHQEFHNAMVAREAQSSTGIGLGVAIPHARRPDLPETFIAVGRSRAGIEYGAPDDAAVHLVFMVGVNSDAARYLQLAARIAWLVRNGPLRRELCQAAGIDELYSRLCEL